MKQPATPRPKHKRAYDGSGPTPAEKLQDILNGEKAARMGGDAQAAIVLDLSGEPEDHALVEKQDRVQCRRCGAGYMLGTPGLLPKQCDAFGYARRKAGL